MAERFQGQGRRRHRRQPRHRQGDRASAFAREGAQTVLAAANAANLAAAAKAIKDAGGLAPLTVAADLRTLAGCEQVFKAVNDKFKRCDVLVNNAGATKGGNFFELPDDAFDRRLRAEIFRRRAADQAVLAAAQGGARQHRQHHRRRRAHAGRGIPHRRFGELGLRQFLQGPRGARQSRRHQRQRHPSRHGRDRPRRHAVPAIRQGAEQDAGAGARGARSRKAARAASASRKTSPSWRCSWPARARGTSRARPFPSMAAQTTGLF